MFFDFENYMRNAYAQSYNFCGDQDCGSDDCCMGPDDCGSAPSDSSQNAYHFINPEMDAQADQIRFQEMLRNSEADRFGAAFSILNMAYGGAPNMSERDKTALLGVALNTIAKFNPEFAAAFRQHRLPR